MILGDLPSSQVFFNFFLQRFELLLMQMFHLLLRRVKKITRRRKYGDKVWSRDWRKKNIQRLPHLGIHSIYNHQTRKLLWMPGSVW